MAPARASAFLACMAALAFDLFWAIAPAMFVPNTESMNPASLWKIAASAFTSCVSTGSTAPTIDERNPPMVAFRFSTLALKSSFSPSMSEIADFTARSPARMTPKTKTFRSIVLIRRPNLSHGAAALSAACDMRALMDSAARENAPCDLAAAACAWAPSACSVASTLFSFSL